MVRIHLATFCTFLLIFAASNELAYPSRNAGKISQRSEHKGEPQPKSPEELYSAARAALDARQYRAAKVFFEKLISSDSNFASEGLRGIAEAFELEGLDTIRLAEVHYRNFVTFFPNSEHVPAARLKLATCLILRISDTQEGLKLLRDAELELESVIQGAPNSSLAKRAEQMLRLVRTYDKSK